MIINEELEEMCNEVVVAYFESVQHFLEQLRNVTKRSTLDRYSKPRLSKYETGALNNDNFQWE
jgi:hypothetical protein